jgi:hypothetical protein
MQPLIAGLTLMLVGFMIGRSTRRQSPPLVIQRVVNETSEGTPPTVATPVQDEKVYTCGARTKKGTPCSRRVHGPVRCWQHKGMPAMVSQEKLLIKN